MLLLFFACVHEAPPESVVTTPAPVAADPLAAYRAAIADAEIADASEISDQLTAIRPDNPALIWQMRPADGDRISVLTWTSWDGYDQRVGGEMALSREIFVTVAPELSRRCTSWGLSGDALDARMEQLLGLPPETGKNRIITLWVLPEDLFRPCPDPEVTDHQCDLDFPPGEPANGMLATHRLWFESLRKVSYGKDGYPWTRLGYTYDWGSSAGTHVGLSEFVIRQGAEVGIASVQSTASLCTAPTP